MIHALTLITFTGIGAFALTQIVRDWRAQAPAIRRAFQDWNDQ